MNKRPQFENIYGIEWRKKAQQELYNPAMQDLKENAVYAGLVSGLGEFEEPTAAMPRSVGRIKTLVDT